jgi:hypothetical protein
MLRTVEDEWFLSSATYGVVTYVILNHEEINNWRPDGIFGDGEQQDMEVLYVYFSPVRVD